ncbi:MAG: LacI family DNA-binding transcriptional regulator [Bifidobacterium sp.]|nr:LacI family DNA-binding transcriptional regulator [Bifidobacterium sp.]
MHKRATITDVAHKAGVSIKTVSNVLNDTGSMRPSTRRRVRQAIEELGYSVNMSARMLKAGSSHLIGLATFTFTQPFQAYFADQVIDAARERGYGVVINTYDETSSGLESIVHDCPRLGADGWVFFADRPLRNNGAVLNQHFPVVLAGDYSSHGRSDSVIMPNTEAVKSMVSSLLESGIEDIGLIGAPDGADRQSVMNANEGGRALRTQGYIEAFDEHGARINWKLLVSGEHWHSSDGERAVSSLLSTNECPKVLMCLNDALAIGAMHELQRRGFRIPEDVQVVGFDNVEDGRFANPALTTIDPDVPGFAAHAVSMLINRIEGFEGPARSYMTKYSLVERSSARLPLQSRNRKVR